MKTHTSQFKQKIKEFGRELDSIITYTLNNEEVELGGEQLNSITPHFEGAILKSVMKQLDIDSNVEIPLNTVINFQFGVKTSNEEVQDYRDNYDYINFGNYVVYNVEKQEDTGSYKITCYDKMLYSMKDYESVGVTYPITIRSYINAICTHLGLTFSNINDTFANYNREIQNELYLDADNNTLGFTFRDVLDQLAQVTASTICINEDDELEIRYINNTNDTINEEYLKDINVNFGEQYGPINTIVLSRSAGSDNVYYPATLPQNSNEIKISDNQIMNFNDRADYLPDIYAKLNGLQYYLNDFASTGITYYDICDRYNVQIGENTYSCIMFNDEINITQGLEENIHTDMPEESETDYTKADKTDRKINQTYLIVNKQLGIIEAKVDEVANISTDASGYGSVTLENIADSEPIEVVVKAIREDISYLYPRNDLFPSDDLYFKARDILFTSGENTITYTIPDDLLHYSDSIYDEFHLDFLNKKCQIIKRVGINDGVKYILSEEETIDYDYPTIHLTEGNWTVSLPSFSTSYVYAKMMVKNDYTSQTASKVELNSQITQTKNNINLELSEVLDGDNKVTGASLMLAINNDESEAKLEADKVDIKANDVLNILAENEINLTSKQIAIVSDNFNVDVNGNVNALALTTGNNVNIGNINDSGSKYLYFSSDTYIRRYFAGYLQIMNLRSSGAVNTTVGNVGLYVNSNQVGISGDGGSHYTASFQNDYINFSVEPVISSDERLKNSIKDIEDISWLEELEIKEYEYNNCKNIKRIGLIAQDYVDKDYSKYFLDKNDDGYYGIRYNNITNALIKYCQELKKQIDNQQEQINQLKEEIRKLKGDEN